MLKPEQAWTVGRLNAHSAFGMSWEQCLRFARAAGVPVYKVSHKALLIPAKPLFAALERGARAPSELADELAAEVAAIERELGANMAKRK